MSHGYGGFTTPSGGGGPQQPDYVCYLDVAIYKAINGITGATTFQNAVAETVVNAALAAAGAGGYVELRGDTFALAAAGLTASANNQKLKGAGRGTLIDGDALGNNAHAINCGGFTDFQVEDLAVQTNDGGGNTSHCIFIEDGADRFYLNNLWGIASDSDFIHIEGTDIEGGWIINPKTIQADGRGIFSDMDGGNYLYYLEVSRALLTGCVGGGAKFTDLQNSAIQGIFHTNGDSGIELVDLCDNNTLDIVATLNALWGVEISTDDCNYNRVQGNARGNTGGSCSDLGSQTDLSHLMV